MKTKETSTRELALAWWNSLTSFQTSYFKDLHFDSQKSLFITDREIEEIWRKETQTEIISEPHIDKYGDLRYNKFEKPNQKQFKQFDESLFKAYIDKFSTKDLSIAFDVFITRLLEDSFIKDNLIEAIKNK